MPFYLPKGEEPGDFGLMGEVMPESWWLQLRYPFRVYAERSGDIDGPAPK